MKDLFKNKKLVAALKEAVKSNTFNGEEEEGGFIFKKDEEFAFEKIPNKNSGKAFAVVLYEADPIEIGRIDYKRWKEGWTLFASFHTHPGASTMASHLDLQKLFTGYQINFIYSPASRILSGYKLEKNEEGITAYRAFEVPMKDYSWHREVRYVEKQ